MLTFNLRYFLLAVLLFATEIIIAAYVHDAFIRPYFGDFLVVILMYCALRSFLSLPVVPAALFVLSVAYCIETLQYFHFVSVIGLGTSRIANLVLGNMFQWVDLVMYTAGVGLVILVEKRSARGKR